MLIFKDGDLRDSSATFICHQTNCQGKMNSGVAKAIREKWFNVYKDYLHAYASGALEPGINVNSKIAWNQWVINMCAQDKYGYDGKQYTDYEALRKCLMKVYEFCNFVKFYYNIEKPVVAIPYMMSCCRGGGDWNVVLGMIEEIFTNGDVEYDVEIWRLDNG